MKTTHFNKLLLTSLVLVAVTGCGKDEKSAAAPAPAPAPAPVVAPVVAPVINNTAATGQQALTNLQSWYGSTTENSVPSMLAKSVKLGVLNANQNNCKEKTYLGFINIQTCFNASINTPTFTTSFVTAVSNGAVKSGNAKLASAISPAAGLVMINVSQTPGNFGHPLYTVDYGKANGHTVRYKIDSGLNSAFNPVEIYDTELGRLEYVANPSELRQ